MAKKKLKFFMLTYDFVTILEVIGALYIFFYLAQIIRGSPLVIGLIFILIAFVIRFFDYNLRNYKFS
ncbi:MAG: hypothetical protein ABSG05_01185 [Candidatus Pacearchaeota archaeon]|jgi:hypothetical protein